ncbi:MAG: hypothetical protein ACT4OS_00705 [Acidimicrobiales bacterium]
MNEVAYAVEGPSDEPVAERLITLYGRIPRRVTTAGGKAKLDSRVAAYNASAQHLPWLVLRDLDRDDSAACIPDLLSSLVGGSTAPRMALRVAVRAAESWLMADRAGFAAHFRLSSGLVPLSPDDLEDPKRSLVDLCRRSRSGAVRGGMVPRPGSGRRVGAEYTAMVRQFALEVWSPDVARSASPSLDRAMAKMAQLVSDGAW